MSDKQDSSNPLEAIAVVIGTIVWTIPLLIMSSPFLFVAAILDFFDTDSSESQSSANDRDNRIAPAATPSRLTTQQRAEFRGFATGLFAVSVFLAIVLIAMSSK